MLRFLVPAVFFLAAGFIYYVNGDPTTAQFVLPGVDQLPWVGVDKQKQLEASWQAFAAMGGLTLVIMAVSLLFKGSRGRKVGKEIASVKQTEENSARNVQLVQDDHNQNGRGGGRTGV